MQTILLNCRFTDFKSIILIIAGFRFISVGCFRTRSIILISMLGLCFSGTVSIHLGKQQQSTTKQEATKTRSSETSQSCVNRQDPHAR